MDDNLLEQCLAALVIELRERGFDRAESSVIIAHLVDDVYADMDFDDLLQPDWAEFDHQWIN